VETTDGTLLGGRVRYAQPARGFRSGIEPVLLAAAVPARPGDLVLEGGSGAGAALLCLAARIGGVQGVGVERDPDLAALLRNNARANGFTTVLSVTGDVLLLPTIRGAFAHSFANPPYHDTDGTPPGSGQAGAKRGAAGQVAEWAAALGSVLRHRGTLSLILPPARLQEALAGCTRAGCGSVRLFPLWPHHGEPARLVVLSAVRGGREALTVLPGLVLHQAVGGFTAAAEACLRGGEALAVRCPSVKRSRSPRSPRGSPP
jgi:tRNA1Val (adenine37-N6)-methyltransferase